MRFGRGNWGPILFDLRTRSSAICQTEDWRGNGCGSPRRQCRFFTPDASGETAAAASTGGTAATEGAFSEDLIGSGSLTGSGIG